MTQPRLRIRMLGPFSIEAQANRIELPTRNAEALLAYLILHPESHPREKVAALFWGDVSDKRARDSLRNELATLRRLLGKSVLQSDRKSVSINPDFPLWVDVWELESTISDHSHQSSRRSPSPLGDLYQGELLPGFYDEWVLLTRQRLEQDFIAHLLNQAQVARSSSDYHQAIDYAEKVLELDPAHEGAHQHLIFCYLALGDRTAALHQFELCQITLMDELGVKPAPDTLALKEWIEHPPSWVESPAARISNLPIPLAGLVGRQDELSEVKKALMNHRLVTLTGPGGIGKTRIAIHAATDMIDQYPDGAWWVDLTAIDQPSHILQQISQAFGLMESRSQDLKHALFAALRTKNTLLLLDNCEHMLEAVNEMVTDLLSHCADMDILVTSRQPLHLPGEKMINIMPLPLPDLSSDDLMSAVAEADSASLFVERAQSARPGFQLDTSNAGKVAQICNQLDGIPLALELAASRVSTMSLDQISARLQSHLDVANVGKRSQMQRHRTLRAAIDWSHELLSEAERTLFRRLSVFNGGFSAEAARVVAGLTGEDNDQLSSEGLEVMLAGLVDKSLLEISFKGEKPTYQMLETIRLFAEQELEKSDEIDILQARHFDYFSSMVDSPNPYLGFFLSDADMERWLEEFHREEGNLRSALEYGVIDGQRIERALEMATNLHWYWFVSGRFSEGRGWLKQLTDRSDSYLDVVHARASSSLGFLACWQGDFEPAVPLFEKALGTFQDLEENSWIAFTTHGLGFATSGLGDEDRATQLFNQSLKLARNLNDQWMIAFSLHFLAIGFSFQERYQEARDYLAESIQRMTKLGGNHPGVGYSHFHLGRIARIMSDVSGALDHLKAALDSFETIGDQRGIAYSYVELINLCLGQARPNQAARLAGALAELQTKLGPLLEETLQNELQEKLHLIKDQLGEADYQVALASGRSLSLNQVTAIPLDLEA